MMVRLSDSSSSFSSATKMSAGAEGVSPLVPTAPETLCSQRAKLQGVSKIGGKSVRTMTTTRSGHGGVGSRDFCVAISGGLVSVLEVVVPLWHVGWAGERSTTSSRDREILRIARTPSRWGALVPARSEVENNTAPRSTQRCEDRSGTEESTPRAGSSRGEETNYTAAKRGVHRGSGFIVMCEGGWVGWFHDHHRNLEVRNCG